MPHRIVLAPGERLAAREVVERPGVLRMRLDGGARRVGSFGVFTGLVQRTERRPDLEPFVLVDLARRSADDQQRRLILLGERRALHTGLDVDERARRRIDALAVEL